MKAFVHHVEGDRGAYIPDHLERLKEQDYFCNHFRDRNLILHDGEAFIVTLKESPYSDKDCMIAYKGREPKQDISMLDDKELQELQEILDVLYKGFFGRQDPQSSEAMFGVNISYKPQAGNIQSMTRLHIHACVHSTVAGTHNHIETQRVDLNVQDPNQADKVRFSLRQTNFRLLDCFEEHLGNSRPDLEITRGEYPHLQLNISIEDEVFSIERLQRIEAIHRILRDFQTGFDWNTYNEGTTGFALTTILNQGDTNVYLRGFEKEPGDPAGSVSVIPHTMSRKLVETPRRPDMAGFRAEIGRIFTTPNISEL